MDTTGSGDSAGMDRLEAKCAGVGVLITVKYL